MKLAPYAKYKPSGIEWIGDVPKHWKVKRLKHSASINDEALSETTDPDFEMSYVEISSVNQIRGIVAVQKVTFEDAPSRARRVVRDGDTIVSTVRTYLRAIAPVSNAPSNMIVSTGFAVVRPRRVLPAFLSYALRESGLIDAIVARSVGVSYPAVNASEIGTLPIPLPGKDEQQAIAGFLDRETAKINALVTKKRTLIERLKEKRAALISRAVTLGLPPDAAKVYGLDPQPKLKPTSIDWLGEVPEHWEVDRIKWSTEGTTNGIWGDEPDGANDLICIRVADFDRERFLVVDKPRTLRAVDKAQRKRRLLHKGDLLIEKSGGGEKQLVGCVVLFDLEFEAVCSNFVARMPISRGHVPRFWSYVHAALYAGRLNYPAVKQTTGIQNLDSAAYLEVRVCYPPREEQHTIANFLDCETEKTFTLVAKIETAIARLQEYRTALITAAVTGKVDVRKTVS